MTTPEEWSAPRLVDPRAPEPFVLGEMAEVRRSWRAQRRSRMARRVWPACVVLLLGVIVGCVVLLEAVLRF